MRCPLLVRTAALVLLSAIAAVHARGSSSSSSSSAAGSGASAGSSSSRPPTLEPFDNETITLNCEDRGLFSVAVLGKQGVFCVAQPPCAGTSNVITRFACPGAGQRDATGATALVHGSCCAALPSGVIGCVSLDSTVLSPQCLPDPAWYSPVVTITASPDATPRVSRVLEPTPTPAPVASASTTNGSSTPTPRSQAPESVAPTTPVSRSPNSDPDAGDPTPQPSTSAPATSSPPPATSSPSPVPVPTPVTLTPGPTLGPTPTPTDVPTPTPTPTLTPRPTPRPTPNQGSQSSGSSFSDSSRGSTTGSAVGAPVSSDADAGFAPVPAPVPNVAALEQDDVTKNDFATLQPIIEDKPSASSPRPTVHRFSDPVATSQPTSNSSSNFRNSGADNALVFIVVGAIATVAVIVGAVILRRGAPDRSTTSMQELERGTPRMTPAAASGLYGASATPRSGDALM